MMGIQAKITFTSLNDTIFPVKRVITLNSQISKITVSRASKSSSKSLHSAGDNAWFDSPVMSRDHAEISLNPDCETLLLRDVGSMHGTSINNSPLVSFVPTQLRNGDVVVFGTEVKRGSETFPPCKFIVNYEISSQKAANTFAYPEYSDFDDDDDISLGDSDLEPDQVMGTADDLMDSLLDGNFSASMERDLENLASISKNDKFDDTDSENENLGAERITEAPEEITEIPDMVKYIPQSRELPTSSLSDGERQSSQNSDSQDSMDLGTVLEAKAIEEAQKLDIDQPTETNTYSEVSSQADEIEAKGDESHIENEINDLSKSNINESQPTTCRKRKADMISGDSVDQIKSCATNSSSSRDMFPSKLITTNHEPINSPTNTGTPPSKRQKIMESLGYVALGGFAAAAGLFSVLVATAPDFT